jgi:hypothetical protein
MPDRSLPRLRLWRLPAAAGSATIKTSPASSEPSKAIVRPASPGSTAAEIAAAKPAEFAILALAARSPAAAAAAATACSAAMVRALAGSPMPTRVPESESAIFDVMPRIELCLWRKIYLSCPKINFEGAHLVVSCHSIPDGFAAITASRRTTV